MPGGGRPAACSIPSAGVEFGRHSHPGEEIVYVIEGALEYSHSTGKPPVTLKAGGVLFIPAGAIHAAKNVGTGNGAELATYIVEKAKPLEVMASSTNRTIFCRGRRRRRGIRCSHNPSCITDLPSCCRVYSSARSPAPPRPVVAVPRTERIGDWRWRRLPDGVFADDERRVEERGSVRPVFAGDCRRPPLSDRDRWRGPPDPSLSTPRPARPSGVARSTANARWRCACYDPALPAHPPRISVFVVLRRLRGLVLYGTDGQVLWSHRMGPFHNFYGMSASPIVADGLVLQLVSDPASRLVPGRSRLR